MLDKDPNVMRASTKVTAAQMVVAGHVELYKAQRLAGVARPDRTAVTAAFEAMLDANDELVRAILLAVGRST